MRPAIKLALAAATFGPVAGATCWFVGSPSMAQYESLKLKPRADNAPGLRARYFGASTVLLSDGETTLLVDGFFSRPSWPRLGVGKIAPDEERIDDALARGGAGEVGDVQAVLVAHSHHDHALDSAVVAEKTGARLVGSRSTAWIACGHGLPADRVDVVRAGSKLSFGSFRVTVFETPHSPDPKAPGSITMPLRPPARFHAYRLGVSFSFLVEHREGRILIVPGANYCPGLFEGVEADVVLLSIGALGKQSECFTRGYWREAVRRTGARLVVPIHWDDFARSLKEPLRAFPRFADRVDVAMPRIVGLAEADGVVLRLMPLVTEVELRPPPPARQAFPTRTPSAQQAE